MFIELIIHYFKYIIMDTKTENTEFSYTDGLKTIYAMIETTRGNIGKNYLYFLIWGYLVALASVSEYLLIRIFHFSRHYLVWPVLMSIGLVISILLSFQQRKSRTHRTIIGSMMAFLWSGWLVAFLILLFYATVRNDFRMILPITLVMYGLGVFVSGGILNFRLMIVGGIIAWIASLISFFQPYDIQLLIIFATVVIAYIIPGHLLFRVTQKQQS
jgi:hypothetical protein